MSDKTIGIDVGATTIHLGVVQHKEVIKELKVSTLPDSSKEEIIGSLLKGIQQVSNGDFNGVGIGVPGLVDEKRGIVYDLWNIPSWKEVNLKDVVEEHFSKPVRVTNDANVFAMGEKFFGRGTSFENLVGVTLGTGFGTGIISNNKLHSGILSSAGEVGSIPYLDRTIEDYCSGKFFKNNSDFDGEKIFAMAKTGDQNALKLYAAYGMHLGNALKLVMHVLSPEAIFLGGSISKAYPFFENSLRNSLEKFPFKKVIHKLVLEPSHTENISILGAAALIVSEEQEPEELSPKRNTSQI